MRNIIAISLLAVTVALTAQADDLAQTQRAQEVKSLAEQRFQLESQQCSQKDPMAGAVYVKCVEIAQQHLQEGVQIASEVMDGKRDMKTLQPKRAPSASSGGKVPEAAFKSEKTRTYVAQGPHGDCVLALKSDTGLLITHSDSWMKDHPIKGAYLFIFKDEVVPRIANATAKYSNGSDMQVLFERDNQQLKFIFFDKEIKSSKSLTLHVQAMNGRVSDHKFDLSDFDSAYSTVKNGCKATGGLWSSIKRKIAGDSQ